MAVVRCPVCGTYVATSGRAVLQRVSCPSGHGFTAILTRNELVVADCEVRDWERFGMLPSTTQEAVLEAIQGGRIPRELTYLMVVLRDAGVVVCT